MTFFEIFIQDWESVFTENHISLQDSDVRKFWRLTYRIGSTNLDANEKWKQILLFSHSLTKINEPYINELANKWVKASNLMSKKDESKVQMIDETMRIEISPKITVIVFPDNSAIFTRKIAGNAVFMTVKIPDIFNESEATRLLYIGSETGAFDILKKIRKIVEQKRFMGMRYDETIEGI